MFKRRTRDSTLSLERDAAVSDSQIGLLTPPEDDSQPPPYDASASRDTPPDITAAFANLKLHPQSAPAQKPTPAQCLAHLKLLEAFHLLREDVCRRDGLFGINDNFAAANNAPLITKIREKRWQVYVSKAAIRFEAWWKNCIMPDAKRQTQRAVITISRIPWEGNILTFAEKNLPPLDVLMVWHAYQLNPRNFLEDCLLYGKMNAWRTGLPWAIINSCIDNESFEYNAGAEAVRLFESQTNQRWNNLQDRPTADVHCAKCQKVYPVAWTQWDTPAAWRESGKGHLFGENSTHGFTDKKSQLICTNFTCNHGLYKITHEVLSANKFLNDCRVLKYQNSPMQGTCLDGNGLPEGLPNAQGRASFFPNRLIKGSTASQVVYDDLCAETEPFFSKSFTMSDVRSKIEQGFKDREYVLAVNGHVPTKHERIALRRMMSCYWDNPSPFSLDLVGAVIRQGIFIGKMHRINWLHSPAAAFTMQRTLQKYDRYLAIVTRAKAAKKGQVAVPTLDVDLAWHTHQLCPPMYYQHTVTRMNMFLNHDDKIEGTVLSTAFEWTSKIYQKMFNELYSECTCWYCEAIRESHAPKATGFSFKKRMRNPIEEQLKQVHSISDPAAEMNHISAHNSIRPDSDLDRDIREKNLKYKLERDYQRAADRARKQGRAPPSRDEYNQNYGLSMPLYMPYEPDTGITGSSGLYSTNPSCATFVPGASGNCAGGSCGGGVAAGACGGGGSCTSAPAGDGGGDGGDGGGCGGGCGGCG